jgi:hypothetical protein
MKSFNTSKDATSVKKKKQPYKMEESICESCIWKSCGIQDVYKTLTTQQQIGK